MNIAPEYAVARRVLLDALAELERHLDNVAWPPSTNTVLHAEGDAWRALRWEEPRPGAFPLVHHLEDVSEPSAPHEK